MTDQNNDTYRCLDCGNSFHDAKAWQEHNRSHEPHTYRLSPTLGESSTLINQQTSQLSNTLVESSIGMFEHRLRQLANDSESEDEPPPPPVKRGPGRPRKNNNTLLYQDTQIKRKQGRPSTKKTPLPASDNNNSNNIADNNPQPTKRKRGRPPKYNTNATPSIKSFNSNQTPFAGIDNDGISEPPQYEHLFSKNSTNHGSSNSSVSGSGSSNIISTRLGKETTTFGGINSDGSSIKRPRPRGRPRLPGTNVYRLDEDMDSTISDLGSISFNDSVSFNDGVSFNDNMSFNDNVSVATSRYTRDDLASTSQPTQPQPTLNKIDPRADNSTLFYGSGNNDEDDDFVRNDIDERSIQVSTISQYEPRPIQLGDRPRPQYVDSLPETVDIPTTRNDNNIQKLTTRHDPYDHIFSNNGDANSMTPNTDYMSPYEDEYEDEDERGYEENNTTPDTRPWIEKIMERDLAQRTKRFKGKFRIAIASDMEKKNLNLVQKRKYHEVKRQNLKREREKTVKSIQDAGGLVWKKPVVNKCPTRRIRLPNKRSPSSSKLLRRLKSALIHCFLTVLKARGISAPTDQHKAMMTEMYNTFERNLPLIDDEDLLFNDIMQCIENPYKAKATLTELVYNAKDTLKRAMEDLVDLPTADLDLIEAHNEWGSVQAAQVQWDDIVANQKQKDRSFLAQYYAQHLVDDTKAKTAADIDSYVLQLKKYPTSRIIPYKL